MRVTTQSLNRHMQNNIMSRFNDLSNLQEQMSTGKRLLRQSDNPIDAANDVTIRSKIMQQNQFKKNIEDGLGFMSITDTAMVSINELIQRSRELAIQGSTDTLTANERKYIQKETEQLLRQMITMANTNYKGDYVFAGAQNKTLPYPVSTSVGNSPLDYLNRSMAWFDASAGINGAYQIRDAFTGDPITRLIPGTLSLSQGATKYSEGVDYTIDYVTGSITPLNVALTADLSDGGNFNGPNYSTTGFHLKFDFLDRPRDIYGDPINARGAIFREIEQNTAIPLNIPGDELLNDAITGTNVFDVLIKLNEHLLRGTSSGVDIPQIDVAFKIILAAQSKNGSNINRFQTTMDSNAQQRIQTTTRQADLEDAEMAEVYTNFSLTENVYNAALKSASRIIQPSLVDFL